MVLKKAFSSFREGLNRPLLQSQEDLTAKVASLHNDVQILHSDVRILQSELRDAHSQLASRISDALSAQALQLMAAGLSARSQRLLRERDLQVSSAAVARDLPFERSLALLKELNPRFFPTWLRLFENGAKGYVEERLGSCSHREHVYAKLFGAYIEIYGQGRILDIGCGPYAMPSYLASHHPDLIYGLEPLEMIAQPSFRVARGFNEFLPWDDSQFDTVVSGTSLDHVLSLDKSLSEVRRVLRPNGKYLVWLASVPGSAPFDEEALEVKAIDNFHLFHFDREWIEPILERYFQIEDLTIVEQVGFDHVFYCLHPRPES